MSAGAENPSCALTSGDAEPVAFVCSEIWGGNRPIDRAVEAPGIRGRLFSKPCGGGSGGDVHYLSVCGSGLLSRICIADVAGHGEQIAAASRAIHGLMRRYMNNLDQRRVLSDLNRKLEATGQLEMTTAAAFTYYPPSRSLSYSYAGHPPAWLYRRSLRRWERLELPRGAGAGLADAPLAVSDETTFSRAKVRVDVGDRMLVLTDGVLEAPAPSGELFGDERVDALLAEHNALDTAALSGRLIPALVKFTGDAALAHDDVTFLMIEFVPGPPGPPIWNAVRSLLLRPRGNIAALEARGAI